MASEAEKREIRRRAATGDSVNKITEEMDLPKSTVYYHFRKEVGQKQKENALEIPDNEEVKGELCGVFAGDGYFIKDNRYHYRTVITLNYNEQYWKLLKEFLTDKLGKEPMVNIQENRARLRYSSKDLYYLFDSYLEWKEGDKSGSVELDSSKKLSDQFLKGFLRGLFDTDGNLLKSDACTFNTSSRGLAIDVHASLRGLGINSDIRRDYDKRENCRDMFRVFLNRENSKYFLEEIRPRNPKKRPNKTNRSQTVF